MTIEQKMVPIHKLKPHPDNYRSHPQHQIDQLVASYERFGQYRSIVCQDQGNDSYLLVAGHGMMQAMARSGATNVRADVLSADVSDDDIKGILIADNLHAQNAQDDDAMLAQLIQEQADSGLDLASLGTDEEALRQMLEAIGDGLIHAGRSLELNEPAGGDVKPAYTVLIECESEEEQQRAYEMAEREGFSCKVLTL